MSTRKEAIAKAVALVEKALLMEEPDYYTTYMYTLEDTPASDWDDITRQPMCTPHKPYWARTH